MQPQQRCPTLPRPRPCRSPIDLRIEAVVRIGVGRRHQIGRAVFGRHAHHGHRILDGPCAVVHTVQHVAVNVDQSSILALVSAATSRHASQAAEHRGAQVIDSLLWGSAMRCQDKSSWGFFRSLVSMGQTRKAARSLPRAVLGLHDLDAAILRSARFGGVIGDRLVSPMPCGSSRARFTPLVVARPLRPRRAGTTMSYCLSWFPYCRCVPPGAGAILDDRSSSRSLR